jgi:hypothetical protein
MKKVFLFHFLCMSFLIVRSQQTARLGIGVGTNITGVHIHADEAYSAKPVVGFKGYIFFDLPLGQGNFGIQPEFSFDALGWHYTGSDPFNGGNTADVRTRMNYFFISLLPKYRIENTGLAFLLGPSYGFLISAKSKGFQGYVADVKKAYTSGDFAGIVGAEYYFPFGFGLSARYVIGFSNLISEPQSGESVHNYSVVFAVSYRF